MSPAAKPAWKALAMVTVFGAASLQLMLAHPQSGNPPIPSPRNETSAASEDWVVNGKVVGISIQPRPGEICLVCNRPVEGDQLAYMVEGQRVAVHRLGEQAARLVGSRDARGRAGPYRRREDPAAGNQVTRLGSLEMPSEPQDGVGTPPRRSQESHNLFTFSNIP